MIEFFKHNISESDIDNVTCVLRSIFLTNAHITVDFEKKFSKYLGRNHTVAMNSCTGALHLALLALGIGPGDEVITTPMTFVATANAILHAGAEPIFVDVEQFTGNLDATKIEAAITEKTKAIMPVHLYGSMCDMKAIKTIADKHNLHIIEDAAHCIEGERDNVRPGELSDIVCFSFYATKNLTSGEGGAAVTDRNELAEKLRKLRLHGINKDAASRYQGAYKHWDMVELGWKYNISDIQSALLVDQLDRLDGYLQRRESIAKKYEAFFSERGIEYIKTSENSCSARHLFVIQVPHRDRFLMELQKRGVGCAVNYRAVHLLEYYRTKYQYVNGDFFVAESIGDRCISIPLYPALSDDDVAFVMKSVADIHKEATEW